MEESSDRGKITPSLETSDKTAPRADIEEFRAPTGKRTALFWVILGGSFLCQCFVLQLFNWLPPSFRGDISSAFEVFVLSLRWGTLSSLFFVVAFVAVWVSLALTTRLLISSLLGLSVIAIFVSGFHAPIPNWVVAVILLLIMGCYVALQKTTAWLLRLKLQVVAETEAPMAAKRTFSLKYLGGWSIALAILLAVSRSVIGNQALDELLPNYVIAIEGIAIFSILFSANFLLASLIQFSALGTGVWWLFVLGVALAIFPITLLEQYAVNQFPSGVIDYMSLLGMNLVQLAWILLTCGLLRGIGYRLVRQ